MQFPTFESYGEYSSGNYGVNSLRFDFPNGVRLYYSYQTIIAFASPFTGLVVCQNTYSTTTGKHLNWIDSDKSNRVERGEFETKLANMLAHYGLDKEEERCKVIGCDELLYTKIRAHAHTEDCSKQPHSCADGGCEKSESK